MMRLTIVLVKLDHLSTKLWKIGREKEDGEEIYLAKGLVWYPRRWRCCREVVLPIWDGPSRAIRSWYSCYRLALISAAGTFFPLGGRRCPKSFVVK